MPKQPAAGLVPPPALGRRWWLTLASIAWGALNLAFFAELWPHTPAARPWLLGLGWLLLLTLPPQIVGWAWRWLRAYTGPGWGWLLGVLAWFLLLLGGVGAWLLGGRG